jgi:hypothetical protein
MTRLWIALLLALSASPAMAEGPGTRIRSGSQLPQPPQIVIVPRAPDACARLQGAERERCIQNERRPAQTGPNRGPGSTGMGAGAGASSTGGTTGGGSFGASAPR